jgi:aminoglycoside 3-N-acetyltransferase
MAETEREWQSQPEVTAAMLSDDLRRLGLGDGTVVLVHSSLSRLGNVKGGADAVIDSLLDAVGPTGTLLFPTLTGTERDGPDAPPMIDVRSTPCWTGRIPETARQRIGARRSLHPTHSITALGAGAGRYVAGHEASETPCDTHSPYYRLITDGGSILQIGDVTQDSNTTLHCLEELAGVPYHLQPDTTGGSVIDAQGRRHIVRNRLHLWKWSREFTKVDAPLEEAGAMRVGYVGLATARLIDARRLADIILPYLQRDPLYLLNEDARREFQQTTEHHERVMGVRDRATDCIP